MLIFINYIIQQSKFVIYFFKVYRLSDMWYIGIYDIYSCVVIFYCWYFVILGIWFYCLLKERCQSYVILYVLWQEIYKVLDG